MFGIDTSRWQIGLNMVSARAEGVEFNIVKAVAADQSALATADGYHSNIDRTLAAGISGKGHYLVPNSQNTPEVSAVFLAEHLHRYFGGDVLALDNEPLDDYATHWRDPECARFFRRLHTELGHPYERMWLYCPAALTRATGPWAECLALGVKIWWVSYGDNDPHREDGEEPLLGGGITRWDVHQYSSTVPISGFRVDGNFSPHRVTDLFGGLEMGYLEVRPARGNITQGFGPRPLPTPTSPPIHYGQDYGWGGGDAIFAARAGRVKSYGPAGSYGNRLIIDHGDGRETWYCHLTSSTVPVGALVSAGQQAAWMGATGNVTAKHLHFELRINGIATDPEPYYAGSSTSGGSAVPIEEEDMDANQAAQLNYVFNAIRGNTTLPYNNIDIITSNVKPVHDALIVPSAATKPFRPVDVLVSHVKAILAGVSNTGGELAAALRPAIQEAVSAALADVTGADADAVAERVELRLADEFAAINANIDDQPITFEVLPKG